VVLERGRLLDVLWHGAARDRRVPPRRAWRLGCRARLWAPATRTSPAAVWDATMGCRRRRSTRTTRHAAQVRPLRAATAFDAWRGWRGSVSCAPRMSRLWCRHRRQRSPSRLRIWSWTLTCASLAFGV